MTDPIVLIIRQRVKGDMFDDFRNHYLKSIPLTKTNKKGTIIQLAYIDDDATEVNIIRIFLDAEALDLQLQGADLRPKAAYKFIEPTSTEIYDTPNHFALEIMKKIAGSGAEVSVKPQFIGGFIRNI